MSDFASLLERLHKAFARVSELEAMAAKFPEDGYVLANLISVKRDAESLQRAWLEEAQRQKKEG